MRKQFSHIVRNILGIDRAIGASAATQLLRFFTGPITMLLILKKLSPSEQGYFYAFSGVAAISVFLEAGFAQSVTQFSNREYAHLRFNPLGLLAGDSNSLSRLRSIFHKANCYYMAIAWVLTIILAIGGYYFFSAKPDDGVPWQIPWVIVSIAAGVQFQLTPFWAVLEGCNRVAEIVTFRFWTTVVGFALTATGLMLHMGIYVTAFASLVVVFSIAYLFFTWRRFLFQILRPATRAQVSWKKEIWGFQWRTALSWVGRYFLESGVSPIAFQLFGPIQAGQVGMSFQLTRMVATIASSWTVTKIPLWGNLAAKRQFVEMDRSWRQSAFKHIIISFVGQFSLLFAVVYLEHWFPGYSNRLLPLSSFVGFSIGWFLYSFWLIVIHYTRANRIEPFTWAHLLVSMSFLLIGYLTRDSWGLGSLSISFAIVHVPAAIWARFALRGFRTKQLS